MNAVNLPTPLTSPYSSSLDIARKDVSSTCQPVVQPPRRERMNKLSGYAVIFHILRDLDGRDKSMKVIQYIIKILLYYQQRHRGLHPSKKLTSLATQLSITRQVLCLGNASHDIKTLMTTKKTVYQRLLLANSIINALSDDVYCLHRIGVLPQKAWGRYSAEISAHCWFLSIVAGLRSNFDAMCKAEVHGTPEEIQLAHVSFYKSVADLLFCGKYIT